MQSMCFQGENMTLTGPSSFKCAFFMTLWFRSIVSELCSVCVTVGSGATKSPVGWDADEWSQPECFNSIGKELN